MLPIELSGIDEKLLTSVCNEKWPESQTLEFKQLLPGADDKSRNEFLKDICALRIPAGATSSMGSRKKVVAPIGLHQSW